MQLVLLAATLLAVVPLLSGDRSGHISTADIRRMVVVPDVHGDYGGAMKSVYLAFKKIEPSTDITLAEFAAIARNVMGGRPSSASSRPLPLSRATDVGLIQLGDLVDRGPYSLPCILLFQAIPQILGWPVWTLYGDHELLSMGIPASNNPYCHERDWRSLGESPIHRDAAYGFAKNRVDSTKRVPLCLNPASPKVSRSQCVAYRRINGPNSLALVRWGPPMASVYVPDYTNPATLFVHGGIRLEWIEKLLTLRGGNGGEDLIDFMNTEIRKFMQALHDQDNFDFMSVNSPLVDSTLTSSPARDLCFRILPTLLQMFQVSRIVVGHTPQMNKRVNMRCGGQLILADAMISRWMLTPQVDEQAKEKLNPVALLMGASSSTLALTQIESVHTNSVRSLFYPDFQHGPPQWHVADNRMHGWQFGRVLLGRGNAVVQEGRDRAGSIGVLNYVTAARVHNIADIRFVATNLLHTEIALMQTQGGTEHLFLPGVCLGTVLSELYAVMTTIEHVDYAEHLLDSVEAIVQKVHAGGYRLGLLPGLAVLSSFCVTAPPAQAAAANDVGGLLGLLVQAVEVVDNPLVKLVNWIGVAKPLLPSNFPLENAVVHEAMHPWRRAIAIIRANPNAPFDLPSILQNLH